MSPEEVVKGYMEKYLTKRNSQEVPNTVDALKGVARLGEVLVYSTQAYTSHMSLVYKALAKQREQELIEYTVLDYTEEMSSASSAPKDDISQLEVRPSPITGRAGVIDPVFKSLMAAPFNANVDIIAATRASNELRAQRGQPLMPQPKASQAQLVVFDIGSPPYDSQNPVFKKLGAFICLAHKDPAYAVSPSVTVIIQATGGASLELVTRDLGVSADQIKYFSPPIARAAARGI